MLLEVCLDFGQGSLKWVRSVILISEQGWTVAAASREAGCIGLAVRWQLSRATRRPRETCLEESQASGGFAMLVHTGPANPNLFIHDEF